MFFDQKKYLQLINITLLITCLITIFSIFIPFVYKISKIFSISLLPDLFFQKGNYVSIWQLAISPVCACLSFYILHFFKLTRFKKPLGITAAVRHTCIPCLLIGFCFFVFLLCFSTGIQQAAGVSIFITSLLLFGLVGSRLYLSYEIIKNSKNPNLIKHIVIFGTGKTALEIGNYIVSHPECGLRLAGLLASQKTNKHPKYSIFTILGTVRDLPKSLQHNVVDCVLDVGENKSHEEVSYLIYACAAMGIDFITVNVRQHAELKKMGTCFFDQINGTRLLITKFVYRPPELIFAKRVFDFTTSIILISLCLPIYVVIALTVKMTSAGPVLFRQTRIGKCGRIFTLYKFRSMVINAETLQESLMHLNEMDGPVFKIKHDPRQTSTGTFIRDTTLDELPQLFNVFKGDISLVGPRPAIVKETLQYRLWERKRLSVAQGITCTWQVMRQKNNLPFKEWMELDKKYIRDWTFAMDVRILVKTVTSVLSLIHLILKKTNTKFK